MKEANRIVVGIFTVGICVLTAINGFTQNNKALVKTFDDDTTQFGITGMGSCIIDEGGAEIKE